MPKKVVINEDLCKSCELCVSVCPVHALAISNRLNAFGYHPVELIDEERCTSCTACARMCPDAAIEVYRLVKTGTALEKE
ncbi:MAG: ferredoxin family protein [Coprothermobacterota bacterium]|nr:ferredoxin family protein [Coprothermobacterota bacterium]